MHGPCAIREYTGVLVTYYLDSAAGTAARCVSVRCIPSLRSRAELQEFGNFGIQMIPDIIPAKCAHSRALAQSAAAIHLSTNG